MLKNEPPLGPHQQEKMRQRLFDEAKAVRREESDLLARVAGVDDATVRSVFFAELRSVLTAAEANTVKETRA